MNSGKSAISWSRRRKMSFIDSKFEKFKWKEYLIVPILN
jgi:hypothetical protein